MDDGQLTEREARIPSRQVHELFKRGRKQQLICDKKAKMQFKSPLYESSGAIVKSIPDIPSYGYYKPDDCGDFTFGKLSQVPSQTNEYATEHILEFQLVKIFLDGLDREPAQYDDPSKVEGKVTSCYYLKPYWYALPVSAYITVDTMTSTPMKILAEAFPSKTHDTTEWVLLSKGVNNVKEGVSTIHASTTQS
jgi:chitinase